jgi:hypothetical protein
MYKKHGRHDVEEEDNDEDTFAQKFFNFMRETPRICCADSCSTKQCGCQWRCPTLHSEQC